ncbi:hypothetical protein MMC14_004334 [Varicellaria rhodocarpa]|nr:hypothetical protein [Varicellaria rhodocarpa]
MATFISLLVLSSLLLVVQGVLDPCGAAFYDPTKYTCYAGNFLCPILAGKKPTFPCGQDCYLPSSYSCTNDRLGPPSTSNTFTILASAPGTIFDLKPIQAAGQSFIVGPSIASSYCPLQQQSACPAGTTTSFAGDSLNVEVPGGQEVYIGPTGALGFTQAHSASYPPGSTFGGFGSSGGEFIVFGSSWYACPTADSTPKNPAGKLFAKLLPTDRVPANCSSVTVLTEDWTAGGFGAWEYV